MEKLTVIEADSPDSLVFHINLFVQNNSDIIIKERHFGAQEQRSGNIIYHCYIVYV